MWRWMPAARSTERRAWRSAGNRCAVARRKQIKWAGRSLAAICFCVPCVREYAGRGRTGNEGCFGFTRPGGVPESGQRASGPWAQALRVSSRLVPRQSDIRILSGRWPPAAKRKRMRKRAGRPPPFKTYSHCGSHSARSARPAFSRPMGSGTRPSPIQPARRMPDCAGFPAAATFFALAGLTRQRGAVSARELGRRASWPPERRGEGQPIRVQRCCYIACGRSCWACPPFAPALHSASPSLPRRSTPARHGPQPHRLAVRGAAPRR